MTWLSSEEALALLGSKPQSLYASVSRGRIRAKPDPVDPRRSLYAVEDVERLARRAAGRRSRAEVAAEAIRWGDPVLTSGLTAISGERLYYRGWDAVVLAESATLEVIAAMLWDCGPVSFPVPEPGLADAAISPLRQVFARIGDRAATDAPMGARGSGVLSGEAASIVGLLAAALGATERQAPVHVRLAEGWRRPQAADVLRRALVLIADHELNASTFAARVTASTGASLAAAVLTGLATLTGPLHGRAAAGLATLLPAAASEGADAAVRLWLAQGHGLPGFGHRLYPQGDVRAAALLPHIELTPRFAALKTAGERLSGEAPNVDFALAALSESFRLPTDAPLLLFALGRSVGWLAHSLEQQRTGNLIRPRASYVGPAPHRA